VTRTRLEEWEQALRRVLDTVDHALEDRFSAEFPRRANRPARQTTANPKYDGLFAVDGKFSLGLVSRSGPGYVIDISLSSSVPVAAPDWERVLLEAEVLLRRAVDAEFPGRHLQVHRDGRVLRLTGDMGL
jgi:hypothetical protein